MDKKPLNSLTKEERESREQRILQRNNLPLDISPVDAMKCIQIDREQYIELIRLKGLKFERS